MQKAYAAHLLTAICEELQLESPHDDIPHEESHAWLQATIVKKRIMPSESTDPVNALHRCFLYAGFILICKVLSVMGKENRLYVTGGTCLFYSLKQTGKIKQMKQLYT